MPTPRPIDPRGRDNPSTYFVEDRSNEVEMIRLLIQDRLVTEGMGGPLAEYPDPSTLHHVLDVGCGPGGWVLEMAALYPSLSLVGIDISWRMIEYANAQAQAEKLTDGVQFLVMDATKPLAFPDATFDLVNMRLGASFILVKDWLRILRELLRVTRPGGVIRVTEGKIPQSTSPACTQLYQMLLCASYKSGQSLTIDQWGITDELGRFLAESGCLHVQTQAHTIEFIAGTGGGENYAQLIKYSYQTLLPFLQKWNCAPENYDTVYQQALLEMQQADFRTTQDLLTVWGRKPS
jgi:ubiquinone/menaquinone biosynthesis C-methylase UbiE